MKERRGELADIETVTHYVQDLRDVLTEGLLIERRSFVKGFVREAVGKDTEVSLEYIFKMLKKGRQRENIGVLSTVYDDLFEWK